VIFNPQGWNGAQLLMDWASVGIQTRKLHRSDRNSLHLRRLEWPGFIGAAGTFSPFVHRSQGERSMPNTWPPSEDLGEEFSAEELMTWRWGGGIWLAGECLSEFDRFVN
jgi:hypothetical protein